MASIARFVSYDGGIAFSETALKIQKRSETQGRIVPVSQVAAIEVSAPRSGEDGCIRCRLVGEDRASGANALYFEQDQYAEALRFQAAFDAWKSRSQATLPPLEMFQPSALVRAESAPRPPRPAERPQRSRQRVPPPEIRPARAGRPRPKRKSPLKGVLIGALGLCAVLLAFVGIGRQFGQGPAHEITAGNTPAVVSAPWVPQESVPAAPQETLSPTPQVTVPPTPDARVFTDQAKAAADGQVGDGSRITDVSLVGRDLQISVDYADPAYLSAPDDHVLLASSERIVEPILALGEQYDTLWDSMTVDYGAYGKVVKHRSDIASQPGETGGSYSRRTFAPANEAVIHDVPVPQQTHSAGTYAVAAVDQAIGAARTDSSTEPPKPTDPPITAPPEQKSEPLVWIPTKGGKKYHATSSCSGMNGPIQVPESEAKSLGFTPCKKCY